MTKGGILNYKKLNALCTDTLRFPALDAVEKIASGRSGLPVGAATITQVIQDRSLNQNPRSPSRREQGRFVLSTKSTCALLHASLHVTGCDLPSEQTKNFRQLGSQIPGRPERFNVCGQALQMLQKGK
jgi:transketolase